MHSLGLFLDALPAQDKLQGWPMHFCATHGRNCLDIFESQRLSLGLLKFSKVLEFGDPFGVRSFCVQFAFFLHSVAFRGKSNMIYTHTIPHGKGRKYPYPTIFSVQRRKFFNLERISSFF